MNMVGLVGKISTEITSRSINNYKVVNFLLSVPKAGKWNKETGKAEYGSFPVEAWGKLAETLEKYCEKGTNISINGSLRLDTWQDTNNMPRERVKIVLNDFAFCSVQPEHFSKAGDVDSETQESAIDPFDVC